MCCVVNDANMRNVIIVKNDWINRLKLLDQKCIDWNRTVIAINRELTALYRKNDGLIDLQQRMSSRVNRTSQNICTRFFFCELLDTQDLCQKCFFFAFVENASHHD